MRTFNIVVERDPDTGLYGGHVPGWPGAHSQGATPDELRGNLQRFLECSWRMASRNSNRSSSGSRRSRWRSAGLRPGS